MCGSTGAQNTIQTEQMQAYQQAQQLMQEEFSQQQAIYGPMAAQLGSIFAAGPGQEGYTPAESAALESNVVEGTATNYAAAARAVGENIAAGSGGIAMPTGAANQMRQQTALSAAQEKSREESQILQANYAQGRANWQQAGEGLMSIAAGENPLGYEEAATGAGKAAADTANQIAQEQNSWINAAVGIGGDIISQNPHNIFG